MKKTFLLFSAMRTPRGAAEQQCGEVRQWSVASAGAMRAGWGPGQSRSAAGTRIMLMIIIIIIMIII